MKPHRLTCKEMWELCSDEEKNPSNLDKDNLNNERIGEFPKSYSPSRRSQNALRNSNGQSKDSEQLRWNADQLTDSRQSRKRQRKNPNSVSRSPRRGQDCSSNSNVSSRSGDESSNSRSSSSDSVTILSSTDFHQNRKTANRRDHSRSLSQRSTSSQSRRYRSHTRERISSHSKARYSSEKQKPNKSYKSHDRLSSRDRSRSRSRYRERSLSLSSGSGKSYVTRRTHGQINSRNNMKDLKYGSNFKIDRKGNHSFSHDRSRSNDQYHRPKETPDRYHRSRETPDRSHRPRETQRSNKSFDSRPCLTIYRDRSSHPSPQLTQDKSYSKENHDDVISSKNVLAQRSKENHRDLRDAISSKKVLAGSSKENCRDLRDSISSKKLPIGKFHSTRLKGKENVDVSEHQSKKKFDLRFSINRKDKNNRGRNLEESKVYKNEWGKSAAKEDYMNSFKNGMYRCDVCDVSVASQHQMQIHMDGKSHRKKSEKVARFLCKLCRVEVTCQATLDSHFEGKHHIKRVKLENERNRWQWTEKEEKEMCEGDFTGQEKEEIAMLEAQVSNLQKTAKSLERFSQHCKSNHGSNEYQELLKYRENCKDAHIRSKIVNETMSRTEKKYVKTETKPCKMKIDYKPESSHQ